jgi:hypothetical protein
LCEATAAKVPNFSCLQRDHLHGGVDKKRIFFQEEDKFNELALLARRRKKSVPARRPDRRNTSRVGEKSDF